MSRSPPPPSGRFFGILFGSSQLLLRPYFLSLPAYFLNLFGVRLSLRACFGNILGSVPGFLLEWTEELAFVLLFLKQGVVLDALHWEEYSPCQCNINEGVIAT